MFISLICSFSANTFPLKYRRDQSVLKCSKRCRSLTFKYAFKKISANLPLETNQLGEPLPESSSGRQETSSSQGILSWTWPNNEFLKKVIFWRVSLEIFEKRELCQILHCILFCNFKIQKRKPRKKLKTADFGVFMLCFCELFNWNSATWEITKKP